jgi:hypothetical protein
MQRDKDRRPRSKPGTCHLPGDAEKAWLAWSGHIQDSDERDMTLLLAAFEAGFFAGRSAESSDS